jgi:hypothetical protein
MFPWGVGSGVGEVLTATLAFVRVSGSTPCLSVCSWISVSVHSYRASSLTISCRTFAYELEPACGLTHTPFLTKYVRVSFRASVDTRANQSTLHSSKSSLNSSHNHRPLYSFLFHTVILQRIYVLTRAVVHSSGFVRSRSYPHDSGSRE